MKGKTREKEVWVNLARATTRLFTHQRTPLCASRPPLLHSRTRSGMGISQRKRGVAAGPPRSLPTPSITGGRCPVGPQTQDVTRFMGSNACEGARAPHQRSGWRVQVADLGLSRGEGRSSCGKGRRGARRRLGARCAQVARPVASLPQLWSAPGCGWRS
jgi:hypothetical protein